MSVNFLKGAAKLKEEFRVKHYTSGMAENCPEIMGFLVGNEIPFDLWIKRKLDAPCESSLKILSFDFKHRGSASQIWDIYHTWNIDFQ